MKKESELLETFNSIKEALMTNNTNVLTALYSKDYRGFNLSGGIEKRDLVLEVYKPGGAILNKFDVNDLDIKVIGNVGIVTGRGYISGVYENTTFEHNVRFLDIYVRKASKWQYYMSQATEITQAK